jgi:flagellar biogenesis protein FliO
MRLFFYLTSLVTLFCLQPCDANWIPAGIQAVVAQTASQTQLTPTAPQASSTVDIENRPLFTDIPVQTPPSEPWYSQLFSFLFKLLLVCALAYGCLFLYQQKKLPGALGQLTSFTKASNKRLMVVESLALSPGNHIHLVSCNGEKLLLLGAGTGGVRLLYETSDPGEMKRLLNTQLSAPHTPSKFQTDFDYQTMMQKDDNT